MACPAALMAAWTSSFRFPAPRGRHQTGATVRRRLVGLLRRGNGNRSPQKEDPLPADLAIDAEVDLCMSGDAYFLQARLNVSLPGLEREVAQALTDETHQTCPYSKATRGNIDVVINLV